MVQGVHVALPGVHRQVGEGLLVAAARGVPQAGLVLGGSEKKRGNGDVEAGQGIPQSWAKRSALPQRLASWHDGTNAGLRAGSVSLRIPTLQQAQCFYPSQ